MMGQWKYLASFYCHPRRHALAASLDVRHARKLEQSHSTGESGQISHVCGSPAVLANLIKEGSQS